MGKSQLDLFAERAGRRISRKLLARLSRLNGPTTVFCGDLADDMKRSLHDAKSIACSSEHAARLLRDLPDYQKRAIDEFYSALASGTTESTMAQVRNALIDDLAETVSLKPAERRARVKKQLDALKILPDAKGGAIQAAIRTHGSIAYNAAIWVSHAKDPRVWGFEYVTAGDERVRPEHSEIGGRRYPKEHTFWRRYAPPNGWNCRCRLRPIFFGDDDARTLPFKGTPDVDPSFRFNPGQIFQKK
jgi:SPP1 gp7 family putative phage head morphogenesis protein